MADPRVIRSVLPLQHSFAGVEDPVSIRVVDHVIKIGQSLFLHEIAQNIDVAVRLRIRCENVVIGNNDDLIAVPDPGILAEFPFKHTDRARSAHVVRHQDVGLHPDVVPRLDPGFASGPRKDLFRQRHRTNKLPEAVPYRKLARDPRNRGLDPSGDRGSGGSVGGFKHLQLPRFNDSNHLLAFY